MKKARILAGVLGVIVSVAQVDAQLHYDPYYSLARDVGCLGATAGLRNSDLSMVGDASDVFLVGKYIFTERFEAGARFTSGALRLGGDGFQTLVVGVKDIINDYSAATLNVLLPVGAVEDPGLSIGYMRTLESNRTKLNTFVQLGFLKGYTPTGKAGDITVSVLVEPARHFGRKATGYADILLDTNTNGNIGDNFGLNVSPNVDFWINKSHTFNLGFSIGVAGSNRQKELGFSGAYKLTLK
jgi:hypothetical protein